MLDLVSLFSRDQDAKTFAGGTVIWAAGDIGKEMYVVLEGDVNIMVGDKVMETVSLGGIFGEMALIDSSPRSAAAVARTDCRLAVIGERRFMYLVQQTPYFALEVMGVMARRLRRQTAL
jgi:CRP/FNR family transcriptional regulator, cyclic AMP receptor protein